MLTERRASIKVLRDFLLQMRNAPKVWGANSSRHVRAMPAALKCRALTDADLTKVARYVIDLSLQLY